MKSLILILALLLPLTSTNLMAREADTNKYIKMPLEIKKTLSKQMNYPTFAAQNNIEGTVAVCFIITPEGLVKINCVNGPKEFKNDVLNKLKGISFPENLVYANKPMVIKYNFVQP